MIIDAFLSFSTPAAPDALNKAAGTYPSNNIIDLGLVGIPSFAAGGGARDIGIGDDPAMKLMVDVTTAFVGAGASMGVILQGAPDNGSGAPGAFYTMVTGPVIGVALLQPGTRLLDIDVPRPPAGQPLPRFLQLSYVISGATTTAGACVSAIVLDRFDQIIGQPTAALSGYPPGIVIAN